MRREVTARWRIEYPVALDNDYEIWRAFNNNYWPALYLADREGVMRHHHFGEGEYEQSELMIRELLGVLAPQDFVTVDGEGDEAEADWARLNSPEKYLGYERTDNFASPGGVGPGHARTYTAPDRLGLQSLGALRRLDGGARAREPERGRRADRVPLPGARRPPGAPTNGTG